MKTRSKDERSRLIGLLSASQLLENITLTTHVGPLYKSSTP